MHRIARLARLVTFRVERGEVLTDGAAVVESHTGIDRQSIPELVPARLSWQVDQDDVRVFAPAVDHDLLSVGRDIERAGDRVVKIR